MSDLSGTNGVSEIVVSELGRTELFGPPYWDDD